MNIINFIGYSGSGKTYFITKAIKFLKNKFSMESAVIKNIHKHRIDKEGKDTFLFAKAGSNYTIAKNIYDECTIFIKKDISINDLIKWLEVGPLKIDVVFTEGFRSLKAPTVLCVRNKDEIEEQINSNVRMISSKLSLSQEEKDRIKTDLPLINIKENFDYFLKIFNIKQDL
jgi:molybdopterin-guanine dinucleotide biosynthesis protein B